MTKSKNTIEEAKLIIELFKTSPLEAYYTLIGTRIYLEQKVGFFFWEEYKAIDQESLIEQFPDSIPSFSKTNGLHLFYDLYTMYRQQINESKRKIAAYNPKIDDLIRSFYLAIELGETGSSNSDLKYSKQSFESIKQLIFEFSSRLNKGNKKRDYSLELFNLSMQLLRLQTDLNLLDDFLDIYLIDDFIIKRSAEGKGFELMLADDGLKENSHFIKNELKWHVKRSYKRQEVQKDISALPHFQKRDQTWNTHKGLPAIFYNSGVKSTEEKGSGITAVQMPDTLFENLDSDDLLKRETATLNLMLKVTEGNFQFRYRHTLDDVFQPNDEIDIRTLHIQLQNGIYITLFELLAAASSLIAFADNLRFLTSGSGIDHIKARIFAQVKEKAPHLSDEEIIKGSELYIVNNLPNLEKLNGPGIFIFADKENLIRNVFRKVEELKDEGQDKLEAIFDILASKDNRLPFNILYPANGNYYFNCQACIRGSIARDLYDYYVTDKLFNPFGKKKEDRIKIDKIQKGREVKFTRSLKNLFKKVTPYSAFRIKYPDPKYHFEFGELQGEFDNLAYFEQENILFVIQVKLSNRTPLSEKRKRLWVEERIEKSAIKQLARDLKLLSNDEGLKFVAHKLKFRKQIPRRGLRIYPLIITDNFFVDHCWFDLWGAKERVICVSYFEIKHLILNQKVHKDQTDWEVLVKNKEGEALIGLIERNDFWNFIQPQVLKYTVSKSLAVIDEANKLHLKI